MRSRLSTFRRIFVLAIHLIRGEIARGPRAFWHLVVETFRTLLGRSGPEPHADNPTVAAASAAEDEIARPDATGPVARVAVKFGLGLLRQGWVEEASWLLGIAVRNNPESPSLLVADERVAAEVRVLKGEWQPPELSDKHFTPVPGRVLHVVGKSLPYVVAGYTVRTQSVAHAQKLAGLDPHVVSRPGFPEEVGGSAAQSTDVVDGITYHRAVGEPWLPWDARLGRAVVEVGRITAELRPALLHAHSDFENALVAQAVSSHFGIPFVYEIRGFWEETWLSKYRSRSADAGRYRMRREREVVAASAADAVVTLAPAMRSRLVGDGVPRDLVVLVPNAVDPQAFPVVARDAEVAARYGIPMERVTVGYVSSLVGYEGIDTLIEAIARVVDAGFDVHGVIVGDGEARDDLEALSQRLGLADRIVFTGRVAPEDVVGHYGLIDVFVVPRAPVAVAELVTPLKPFEALSTGRTLVVSSVAALRPIAEESKAAEVFTAGDAENLTKVLKVLVQDPSYRDELAKRGAAWVREERTWEANADRYVDLYRGLGAL